MSSDDSGLGRIGRFICTDKFLFFISLFCSFMSMGLVMALLGPSLLELGEQTHSEMSALIPIFAARSFGFFLGTLIGGRLVDKYAHFGKTIMSAALACSIILTLLTPVVPFVGLLMMVCLAQGTALGIIDNVAQILLIRLMTGDGGKECQPYMQALHAAFGVGAFISPLIISPFLGGDVFIDPSQVAEVDDGSGSVMNSTSTSTVRSAAGSTSYQYAYYLISFFVLPILCSMSYYMQRDEQPFRKLSAWWRGDAAGRWTSVGETDPQSASGSASGQRGYADEQVESGDAGDIDHERGRRADADEIEMASSAAANATIDLATLDVDAVDLDSEKLRSPTEEDAVFRPDDSPPPTTTASNGRQGGRAKRLAPIVLPGNGSSSSSIVVGASSASSGSPSDVASPFSPSSLAEPTPGVTPLAGPMGLQILPETDWAKWKMVLLIAIFLFLYVGTESGYGGFIFSYGIKQANMEPHHAAYLNSAFWFSFACGRLLGIPISLRFSATAMIFSDLLGCIVSLLFILSFHDTLAVLWIGTCTYGVSVASIYPSAISYAESQVAGGVTGKVLSCLVVAASFGDAIIPLLMGLSFSTPAGPMGMMLLALAVAVGAAVIFAIIVGFVAPDSAHKQKRRERREKRRRRRQSMSGSVSIQPEEANGDATNGAAASGAVNPASLSPRAKPRRSDYSAVEVDVDAEADAIELERELEEELRRPHTPSSGNGAHSSAAAATTNPLRSPIQTQRDRLASDEFEVEDLQEL